MRHTHRSGDGFRNTQRTAFEFRDSIIRLWTSPCSLFARATVRHATARWWLDNLTFIIVVITNIITVITYLSSQLLLTVIIPRFR